MNNGNWHFPDLAEARRRTGQPTEIIRDALKLTAKQRTLGANHFYMVRTYGCQANFRDHETICGILEAMGYNPAASLEQSDLILLNTCAIRDNAERKVFGELGNLKHLKKGRPGLIIGLCGCMPQQPEVVEHLVQQLPFVDIVFGTHNLNELPAMIEKVTEGQGRQIQVYSKPGDIYEGMPAKRSLRHKEWVEIMDGCDKFCTYCIVPYTRGRQRSRLARDVVAEVNSLKKEGCREVTLLGQNVNAYGKDLDQGCDFASLLTQVAATGIDRVRFMTSHPWDFSEAMVEAMADNPNIMPAVHLPLQSGNDEILRRMGRRYTSEQYLRLFDELKERIPGIAITTDLIVGFPGEDDQQFADTLAIYERCRFDNAFTFIYSPRPGTPAAAMPQQVEEQIKKQRLLQLNAVVDRCSKQANMAFLGQKVSVLVDGPSKKDGDMFCGYEPHNKLVNFAKGDCKIGDIIDVIVVAAMKNSLDGRQDDNHGKRGS